MGVDYAFHGDLKPHPVPRNKMAPSSSKTESEVRPAHTAETAELCGTARRHNLRDGGFRFLEVNPGHSRAETFSRPAAGDSRLRVATSPVPGPTWRVGIGSGARNGGGGADERQAGAAPAAGSAFPRAAGEWGNGVSAQRSAALALPDAISPLPSRPSASPARLARGFLSVGVSSPAKMRGRPRPPRRQEKGAEEERETRGMARKSAKGGFSPSQPFRGLPRSSACFAFPPPSRPAPTLTLPANP